LSTPTRGQKTSFSKILFPGVRLGWLVAPWPVVDRLASIKQYADLHSNTLAQWALTKFIEQGWLKEHLVTLRQTYPHWCQAMLAALCDYVPQKLRWNEPTGGFYLWCHLEKGVQAKELLAEAARRRVAFVVGEAFHADGGGQNAFRLNFTYHGEQDIREGIRRLGEALATLMRNQKERHVSQRQGVWPIV